MDRYDMKDSKERSVERSVRASFDGGWLAQGMGADEITHARWDSSMDCDAFQTNAEESCTLEFKVVEEVEDIVDNKYLDDG